jgi:hypothetical protein
MGFRRVNKGDKQPKLVWWPVVIQEPKDGGRAVQHKVEVQFEILDESEKDQLIDTGGDQFLHRAVRDWKHFEDADGSAIECTEESRSEFFELSYVKTALLQGYFVAAVGGRRKN